MNELHDLVKKGRRVLVKSPGGFVKVLNSLTRKEEALVRIKANC